MPVDLPLAARGLLDTPGGMDWKLSVLLTTTVTRISSPDVTNSLMSALKGVYPPSWLTTSWSSTHKVAGWVADSKCRTARCASQPRGTRTMRWYQTSPRKSRTDASARRSLKLAGTAMSRASVSDAAYQRPSRPVESASSLNDQIPSRFFRSRVELS